MQRSSRQSRKLDESTKYTRQTYRREYSRHARVYFILSRFFSYTATFYGISAFPCGLADDVRERSYGDAKQRSVQTTRSETEVKKFNFHPSVNPLVVASMATPTEISRWIFPLSVAYLVLFTLTLRKVFFLPPEADPRSTVKCNLFCFNVREIAFPVR